MAFWMTNLDLTRLDSIRIRPAVVVAHYCPSGGIELRVEKIGCRGTCGLRLINRLKVDSGRVFLPFYMAHLL